MNKQEVFSKVVEHLLKQKKRSVSKGGCVYRGGAGTKCAIGCLIPDSKYNKRIEGCSAADEDVVHILVGELGDIESDDVDFLVDLQSIHDRHNPDVWRESLSELAHEHGLEMPS